MSAKAPQTFNSIPRLRAAGHIEKHQQYLFLKTMRIKPFAAFVSFDGWAGLPAANFVFMGEPLFTRRAAIKTLPLCPLPLL